MDINKKVTDNTEETTNDKEIIINNVEKKNNIEELYKSEIENWKTKYTYLLADLENTKKRFSKIIENDRKYKYESFFLELLNILDDFDNIRKNIDESQADTNENGILLIYKKLYELLSKFGLKKIYDENHKEMFFNDKYDEAIFAIDVEDKELDNTISEVAKPGYKYKDKILRYEQVVVNKFKSNSDVNNK